MKTTTTTNLASAAMLVLLSPFLALAIIVSVKSAGVVGNDVLLVLLTLSGAVLSGINGFGRRTSKTVRLTSAAKAVDGANQWSTRQSTNA